MDSARVEGYLRSACSVLDCDVGEFWRAEKIPGQAPTLNFVQLYTSPTYDRSLKSLLLRPEMSRNEDQTKAEELHQISPVICRSVCDGGQIVWANSNVAEGLVENSRVRLATAVGMPICSIGGSLCVIVLFATQPVPMTPNAVEFLCSMARAASGVDNTSGFAPSPYSCTISPSYAKTEQFRGVWDISERLNATYTAAIDFHLLPIKRLQAFFDFQEVASFNDLFGKDSATHPLKPTNGLSGSMTADPFLALEDFTKGFSKDFSKDFSTASSWDGNSMPESDDTTWINANFNHPRVRTVSEVTETSKYTALTADALTMTSMTCVDSDHTRPNLHVNTAYPGTSVDTNSCCSSEIDEDEEISDGSSLEFVFEDDVSRGSTSPICLPSPKGYQVALQIDARASFRMKQSRFHEFMDAIIGLTHFDCAELWLLSDLSPELYVVSALHRDEAVHMWTTQTKGMRLQKGMDVPGIVFETGRPHWDKHYHTRHLRRASRKIKREGSPRCESAFNANPRSELAAQMGICTAFGVPLPGPSGDVSGVLALYSRVKVEPDALLLTLVHKSVQLMSASATVRPVLSQYDVEQHAYFQSQYNAHNNNHELPSILENPYSFFCQTETPKISPKIKSNTAAFSFVDYTAKDRQKKGVSGGMGGVQGASGVGSGVGAGVSEDMAFVQDTSSYGQYAPLTQKSAWVPQVMGPGHCLYRTVSASELMPTPPQPIFHSHSMPDSMYLKSSYANLDIPRSKRARSIDLGSTNSSIPTGGMRQNASIPTGIDVFDHIDLQWSSFNEPYDVKNVANMNGIGGFQFNNTDNFSYMMPEALKTQIHNQYRDFRSTSGGAGGVEESKGKQFDHMPYNYAVPILPPTIKINHMASDSMTQIQAPIDSFNADLTFHGDFTFDKDLSFTNYNSSADESTSPTSYPPCRVDGCDADSSHRSPFCVVHAAGGRRCQHEGCNKCAQGSTCYCIAHGGGRRCTFLGCGKGARDKFFCAGHGGGKRCVSSDCTKSAVGGSKFCTGHGGGKRCKVDGCDKSAQSSTLHCVKHGGGRKCTVERCTKVARGKTDFCAAHGGGTRCRTAHCSKAAVGRYQFCRPHYSAIHGSESAAKMLDEEDEYTNDEDEEMRCGDCVAVTVA